MAAIRARLDRMITDQQAKQDAHAAGRGRRRGRVAATGRPATDQHRGQLRHPAGRTSLVKAQAWAAHLERQQASARERVAERAQRRAERAAAGPPTRANLTDPNSRLMPTRRGWVQGYNVQLAVADDQLIVATQVGQTPGDIQQFLPMLAAAQRAAEECRQASGRNDLTIEMVLADAGYASDTNLTAAGPDRLIALGKAGERLTRFGRPIGLEPGAADL